MSDMTEETSWVQRFVDRARAEVPSKDEGLFPMSDAVKAKLEDIERRRAELDREMRSVACEWWDDLIRAGAQRQIAKAQAVLDSLDKKAEATMNETSQEAAS